ncbi:hypothetical protein E2562_026704 [Oryza meyeriana var. granulata]|uniref:Uncharacterized protein n=1 Tax=Oryza meyeriana var. granulata TaxID=110450 RepID=A0A6G1E264_9ORYZ|nr:hypothetical protein E2562_026704 [Oryza meyeriana var. granulata]
MTEDAAATEDAYAELKDLYSPLLDVKERTKNSRTQERVRRENSVLFALIQKEPRTLGPKNSWSADAKEDEEDVIC